MTSKQRGWRVMLLAVVLAAMMMACSLGAWWNGDGPGGRATLTYAAWEWYAQQTAMAEEV